MASIRVHEAWLTRIPAEDTAPPPKIRVHEVQLFRVSDTPEPLGPRIRVHGVWLTRGFEPPVTQGGVWVRNPGTWRKHLIKAWHNGVWI